MTRFWIDYVVVISNLFVLGHCVNDGKYEFQMYYVEDILNRFEYAGPEEAAGAIEGGQFPSNDDALRDLCMAAKDHALADLISDTEADIIAYKPTLTRILVDHSYWPKRDKWGYLFGCNTLPKLWIHPDDDSGRKFTLMIQSSYYADAKIFTYEVRTVRSQPVPLAEDDPVGKDVIKNTSSMFKEEMEDLEMFHLCMNSRRKIELSKRPVLRNSEIRRRVFKFDFPTGEEKIYAFECPSTPAMYTYFVDVSRFVYDVRVIVFDPSLASQPNGNNADLVSLENPTFSDEFA